MLTKNGKKKMVGEAVGLGVHLKGLYVRVLQMSPLGDTRFKSSFQLFLLSHPPLFTGHTFYLPVGVIFFHAGQTCGLLAMGKIKLGPNRVNFERSPDGC